MNHSAQVTAAQAAAQAGAAYVWSTSHSRGLAAGWKAGWAAALDELHPFKHETNDGAAHVHTDMMREAVDSVGRPACEEEETEDKEETKEGEDRVELCAEWAALFAAGDARRMAIKRRKVEEERRSITKGGIMELDLGGREERERCARGVELYGEEGWKRLEEIETGMERKFERRVRMYGARLWPVISVREGEGRGNGG